MRDQRKVREMSLYVGIQDGLRTGVAEGRAVLVQQIHQLLGDGLGGEDEVPPPVLVHGIVLRPRHELRDLPSGKLRLANITKVSGKMYRLSCNEMTHDMPTISDNTNSTKVPH